MILFGGYGTLTSTHAANIQTCVPNYVQFCMQENIMSNQFWLGTLWTSLKYNHNKLTSLFQGIRHNYPLLTASLLTECYHSVPIRKLISCLFSNLSWNQFQNHLTHLKQQLWILWMHFLLRVRRWWLIIWWGRVQRKFLKNIRGSFSQENMRMECFKG